VEGGPRSKNGKGASSLSQIHGRKGRRRPLLGRGKTISQAPDEEKEGDRSSCDKEHLRMRSLEILETDLTKTRPKNL